MKIHDLKITPGHYQSVSDEVKTFEVRNNDRDFKRGDYLLLREWNPDTKDYTGRKLIRRIIYVLDDSLFVIEGYVVLSLGVPDYETNLTVLEKINAAH